MLKRIAAGINNIVQVQKHTVKKIALAAVRKEPVVAVQQGRLQGAIDELYDGTPFFSFKGIPFAKPPVGPLRFQAPLPPERWQGIRDATQHGNVCVQHGVGARSTFQGDEDCLFLNVYTKTLSPSSKVPVMVFIHGGGYFCGSGNDDFHGPKFLLQHDVVLVTINYRLEVLGFLCLDIPEAPGNAGMKDQVAALKWVKENIEQFGGDSNNITIFGESAGASCVVQHMQSPMSQGLFHKAIAQSGSSIHDWSIGRGSKKRAFRVGECLGYKTKDTTELFKYLKNIPASKLTHMTAKTMSHDEKQRCLPMQFLPVIEKNFEAVDPFLSEEPMDILLSKKMRSIPLLIGYNSAEGIAFILNKLKKLEFFNKNTLYNVPREIAHIVTQEKMVEIGEMVKKFYIGEKGFREEDLEQLTAFLTDFHYVYNVHRFAHFYSGYNSPIFMYRFSFETELNFYKNLLGFNKKYVKGACHADDLFYMFSTDTPTYKAYAAQEELRQYVWNVTKLWTNFVKTRLVAKKIFDRVKVGTSHHERVWADSSNVGPVRIRDFIHILNYFADECRFPHDVFLHQRAQCNPTPDDSLGVEWPRYTAENKEFLNINADMTPGEYAERERVQFWDKIYKEVGLPCIH